MKVGLDFRAVTAAPKSGVARQTLALHECVRRRAGTEVLALTAAPADHPHRHKAVCPVFASPVDGLHRPAERWRFERHFLPEAITAHGIDVYVASVNMGLPIGLTAAQRQRTRWVLHLHDVFQITQRNRHASAWRERAYRLIDRFSIGHAVRLADAIWVPSDHTAQSLMDLHPHASERIRVLPNAVPAEAWRCLQQDVFAPPRYWLVVGTREPRKNVPWFVAAWAQARRQWPELIPELVLIGHPDDVPGAPEGVRFVHGIQDAQLAGWYRQAERLWHPSLAEGFGLPVVEAAACGTPVASARGSALDEVTPPGSPRFDPHDTAALLALMHQVAEQRRSPSDAPERLLQWAQRYDLPAHAQRVDELLEELV
ncbi:MAG: glycosyltransferase family 4 protein [Proteobacteria bacterium]|uniref:glycosyltransferase family 4 protein n=1 Tax=Aquabacterium sp. TaxID=1872578 RepID=UPI0035C73CAE|nr:glycosyltransferase family 4 protein [Pseudomonadota bacterium]